MYVNVYSERSITDWQPA